MNQRAAAFDPTTLAYFGQKIQILVAQYEEKENHNKPLFVEDLQQFEAKTGERKTEIEFHQRLKEMNGQRLDDLRAASDRIHDGNYGFCQNPACGQIIPFARLEIIPEAKYCVSCQAKKPFH